MKKIHRTIALLLTLVGLVGCITLDHVPLAAAHIKFDLVDSPVIGVEKTRLDMEDGQLVLTGYVVKIWGATDTTITHLDVTIYDFAGHILSSTVAYFEPRQIPPFRKMNGSAHYRVVITPSPEIIARIEVRAREGSHGDANPAVP